MRISDWSSDVCSSDLLAPGAFEERLARHPLHPCIGLNPQSRGWVGPATTNAQLVYAQGKQMLIALGVEQKLLPSSVVQQAVDERASELEQRQGFKQRSEEHTSELQSLMRISYAVFCLTKKMRERKKTKP